ncbi:acyl-CoA carboxylase epsilon subunit [Streptomyces sp. enrichment culture]|uniref:acyl-CoA carboxylase epsilon subunit n=1 Tax=Streptomyces sp. enrichment culture TaxID=1795815 RepID=UPI003F57B760
MIRIVRGSAGESGVAAVTAVLLALAARRPPSGGTSASAAPGTAPWCRRRAGGPPRPRPGRRTPP